MTSPLSKRGVRGRRHASVLVALALVLWPSVACRRHNSLDNAAQAYVRLALALGERDADSLDSTTAPQQLRRSMHDRYLSLESVAEEARKQRQALESDGRCAAADGRRCRFLAAQFKAIEARSAMIRGHVLPFSEEAKMLFGTAPLSDVWSGERLEHLAEIAALLPPSRNAHSRLTPPLATRYDAFRRQFLIPPENLGAVINAAIRSCRAETTQHIRMPANESVDVQFVRNKPWAAFSRYVGNAHSVVSINADFPLTLDDALELACHETYPGHHLLNTLRQGSLATQQQLTESEVMLTFSPEGYASEALAAYAPRLAFSEQQRAGIERDILLPLAMTRPSVGDIERAVRLDGLVRSLDSSEPAIAREYLDGRLEFVRAEDHLASEALFAHAESALLYLNEYRSYMLAYTDGSRRVAAAIRDARNVAACANVVDACTPQQWAAFEQFARSPQPLTPADFPSSVQ